MRLQKSLLAVGVALTLAVPLLTACDDRTRKEEHVLNRTGYGPDDWSRQRIRQLGIEGYIEEQLHPSTLDDTALEAEIATRYPLTTWALRKIRMTYNEYNADPQLLPGTVRHELSCARMLRNVHSKRQLEQVLVDFWFNHFNVDGRTEIARWGIVPYERDVIRPHVLGRFRDMLGAVAKHPAMLEYLDNSLNGIPGYRSFGPNENYARELLELHTVGVDAGYTLHDIQEVARAFTGWTINYRLPNGFPNSFADQFVYDDDAHDQGAKTVMGLQLPANGGIQDGERVLDFLSRQPATARFVSYKLAQRFIADDPPKAVVEGAALVFLLSDGDLRATTRAILLSPDFLAARNRRTKVKRPQHYIASLARAVGVVDNPTFARRAVGEAATMGEDLYAAAPPTGYPETSAYWSGEGPFVFRVNLALVAAAGTSGFGPAPTAPLGSSVSDLVGHLANRLVFAGLNPSTMGGIVHFAGQVPGYARNREVAAAILSSPEFLVH